MSALAEIAEARKRWRNGTLEASPPSWAAAGKTIPGRGGAVRSRRTAVFAGALVPAMVVGLLWLGRGSRSAPDDVPPEVRTIIARSAGAGLVLPGFERGAPEDGAALRGSESPALREYVGRLEAGARAEGMSPKRAYLLAATALAEGRLNAARAHAESGRRLSPDDARFLIVAAVVAYRESDLQGAKQLLEEARRWVPSDPVVRENLEIVIEAIDESSP
jgi:hypothetical protein